MGQKPLLCSLFLWLSCLASLTSSATTNSSIIVAFAANEGWVTFLAVLNPSMMTILFVHHARFQYKLIAVIERIRSMQHGRTGTYKLIGFDL
jgi:hypothetical protein